MKHRKIKKQTGHYKNPPITKVWFCPISIEEVTLKMFFYRISAVNVNVPQKKKLTRILLRAEIQSQ